MLKRVALKSLLAISIAFSFILLFLGGLAIADRSTQLYSRVPTSLPSQEPKVSQDSATGDEAKLPARLPLAQQEAITPAGFEERVHWQRPSGFPPPSLPEWVSKLENGGLQPASNHISIVKSAVTLASPGGTTVEDGERITYTIRITNNGNIPLAATVLDILPRDPQGNIQLRDILIVQCGLAGNQCLKNVVTNTIPFARSGGSTGTLQITETTAITWEIQNLAIGQAQTFSFSGLVFCQPNGVTLRNRAFYFSETDGSNGFSNQVETLVTTSIDENGGITISPGPTACTTNTPTAKRLSAGDFDADGDLDLAFGSITGLSVFRNNGQGRFAQMPNPNDIQTEDVLWADFDNDGDLELLGVGLWDSIPGQPTPLPGGGTYFYTGFNYLYRFNGTSFSLITNTHSDYTFQANDGLAQVAAGDYDGDGYPDLAAANFWGGCTVLIYRNRQFAPFFVESLNYGANLDCLLENQSAYSVAWGDVNNDGDQDLAIGFRDSSDFQLRIKVFTNTGSAITVTGPGVVEPNAPSSPIDLAWGDYNRDGLLDLAAAFNNGEFRVYQNQGGTTFAALPTIFNSGTFGGAVDWADFDGDGNLELIVAASQLRPRVLKWNGVNFSPINALRAQPVNGTVSGVRGFDADNDGDMDLGVTNFNGVSLIYTLYVPRLRPQVTALNTANGHSTAWGDVDQDGDLDLLIGGGAGTFGSQLHLNNQGVLGLGSAINTTGFGPHSVAWGDFDKDFDLDAAITTGGEYQIYRNGGGVLVLDTALPFLNGSTPRNLAWLDSDDDGDLDLLTGNTGRNVLFETEGGSINSTPAWVSAEQGDTRSVAWTDFNGDFFPDFATGVYGGQTRLYLNTQNNTFVLHSSLPASYNTTSIAWADWDGDGQMELALGNEGQPNTIYKWQGNLWTEVWSSTNQSFATTSLAWGDWDNDTDLDLAVGNRNAADQVYENTLAETGQADLIWRWTSGQAAQTTGVAWGDIDNDGDLDLAVSAGAGTNGVYINNYVSSSHLASNFAPTMPLPNNPSYLSMPRPGSTAPGYFFSAAEVLASPAISTVNITFNLFDPDGSRANAPANIFGDDILSLGQLPQNFEYSTNGGGTWQPVISATLLPNASGYEETLRRGRPYILRWNVQNDQIVSDDVRFRITLFNHLGRTENNDVVPNRRTGLNQRSKVSAISPPFRVRALTCFWPSNPAIQIQPTAPYSPNMPLQFTAAHQGSGSFVYSWDFGDTITAEVSTSVQHIYTFNGTYTITLTINGEACPIARSLVTTRTLIIGTGIPDRLTYMPLILKSGPTATSAGTPGLATYELEVVPGGPGQVTGLSGSFQPGSPTGLTWQANPAADQILGYRVYRSQQGSFTAQRISDLPATATAYTDSEAACGVAYFVTAYNQAGESLPSTSSYYTWPCQ